MPIYRDIDFRQGSTLDRMGAIGTPTGITWKRDLKGNAIETGQSKYIQYNSQLLSNTTCTVVAWARAKKVSTITDGSCQIIGVNTASSSYRLGILGTDGNCIIYLGSSNYRIFTFANDGNFHCFIFIIPGALQTSIYTSALYVDGVLLPTNSTNASGVQDNRSNFIYTGGSFTANGGGNILRIKVYDHVLSTAEINNEQIEFNNSVLIDPPIRSFELPKVSDLSRLSVSSSGNLGGDLLSGWNFTSGWSIGASATINSAAQFTTTGAGGGVYKAYTVINGIYKLHIKGTTTATSFSVTNTNVSSSYSGNLTGSFDITVFFTAISDTNLYLRNVASGTTTISEFTIQQSNGSLLAAWNFVKNPNNTLTDISGNNNNLALSNVVQDKNGLQFNGVNSVGSCTGSNGLTGDITIACRIYANNSGEGGEGIIFFNAAFQLFINSIYVRFGRNISTIVTGAAHPTKQFFDVVVTSTSSGISNFYINGIISGSENLNAGTPSSSTAWYVGNRAANDRTFNGIIQDLQIYNTIKDLAWIKKYHNSFIKPYIVERFKGDCIGAAPKNFVKGTGVYKVFELSSSITSGTLKLPKGTRGIECTSAGTIALQSNQAYGTWEFGLYKASNLNLLLFGFVNNISSFTIDNGYRFGFTSGEQFVIAKRANGISTIIMLSVGGYASVLSYYKVKIIRTTAGVFTVLMKGGALTVAENACTFQDTGDTVTKNAHGFANGTEIRFTSIVSTTGISTNTKYYVVSASTNTFQVAATYGGTALTLTTNGSGSFTTDYDGWHLVSTSGGSGANPVIDTTYSSSNYLVLDLDSGDRFFDLQCYDGIKQL